MAAFLGNLRNVVIAGFVLALVLFGIYCANTGLRRDRPSGCSSLRWLQSSAA